MDLLRRAGRSLGGTPQLPVVDEKGKKRTVTSRLAYLRRPLRLKGNSSISVPLGVVILFPCIVVVLILLLFVRHPSSAGRILMPAGAPPAIKFVFPTKRQPQSYPPPLLLTHRALQENQRKTRQGLRHRLPPTRHEQASRQCRIRRPRA